MSPVARGAEYRDDPSGTFDRTVASVAPPARRPEGCTRETKVRAWSPAFARWILAAWRDPAVSDRELWGTVRRDVGREAARIAEQQAFRRRREASARRQFTVPAS